MNKRILSAFLLLLASLAVHGLTWWLYFSNVWRGTPILLLVSGLVVLLFVVVWLKRIDHSSRPAPMD